MPRVLRTVVPRIRRSLAERGLLTSLRRSVLLPIHLVQEYREARTLRPSGQRSRFDLAHGVDTDGELAGWTHLSDLKIDSPNWIEGVDYRPIEPERFSACLSNLDMAFEDFTFIDYGSGKGRALLMASDLPFRRVIGLEFSRELHEIAQKNIRVYKRAAQGSRMVESRCVDFLHFALPPEPCVLFFFDPCSEAIFATVLEKIRQSLVEHPRELWLIYVAPGRKERLLDAAEFLVKAGKNESPRYCWYRSK
jgi:hypothetical protein